MKNILRLHLFIALAAVMALTACIRRPLEVYYVNRARIMLHVDWDTEFHRVPRAMTVNIYDEYGQLYNSFLTNDVDSVPLSLPVGRYKLIIFNGETANYTSFHFRDENLFDHFRTEATENTSMRNAPRTWDAGTRYTWQPDELIGAAVDSFEIDQEMIDRQIHFLHYTKRDQAVGQTAVHNIYEVVHPLQTMVHIEVYVTGMQWMYTMEAALSGMADGCSMARTWRNTSATNVLYTSGLWDFEFETENSKDGWVRISIPTWGEPHGKELLEQRDSTDNVLTMHFETGRDTTRADFDYVFNVGHIINYGGVPQRDPDQLTPPDVLRHLYIRIKREIPLLPPPDKPQPYPTGAGFDAQVDPWEEGDTYNLGPF